MSESRSASCWRARRDIDAAIGSCTSCSTTRAPTARGTISARSSAVCSSMVLAGR